MNREYDFTLVLIFPQRDDEGQNDSDGGVLTESLENALFEAGCDDATIVLRSGRIFLTFSRESCSLKEAVLSAIRDVHTAGIGAEVMRANACNLVTQADIARRIGRSRQLVHQYISGARGPGRFPPPVCEITDGAPMWSWCEVAQWLWDNSMIPEQMLREAEELAAINSILELQWLRRALPNLTEEILRSLNFAPAILPVASQ